MESHSHEQDVHSPYSMAFTLLIKEQLIKEIIEQLIVELRLLEVL